MKTCQGCEITKDEAEFVPRSDGTGRLRPYCKVCARDAQRSRYAHHKRTSPFLLKASRAKSRAQYLKVPYDLTPEYLQELWTGVCPASNREIFLHEKGRLDEYAAELDRFIPELGYVKGNVTFLSRRMNRLKNSALVGELETLLNWMKEYENKRH